jgi:hypothetical protein
MSTFATFLFGHDYLLAPLHYHSQHPGTIGARSSKGFAPKLSFLVKTPPEPSDAKAVENILITTESREAQAAYGLFERHLGIVTFIPQVRGTAGRIVRAYRAKGGRIIEWGFSIADKTRTSFAFAGAGLTIGPDGRLLVIKPFDAVEAKNVGVRVFVDTHLYLPSSLELL